MKTSKGGNLISSLCAAGECLAAFPHITDAADAIYDSGKGIAYVLAASFAFFVMHMILAILLHEAGHCVAGLLSGYTLTSFRAGPFMLIDTGSGFRIRKLHLQGTAGQCIRATPDMKDGNIPFVFYNLGGALMNLIAAAVSLLICVHASSGMVRLFFAASLLIELLIGLTNGIPLVSGGVNNDGMNIVEMSRDPRAVRAFWIQLKVNQQLARNVRTSEMPGEWFELPSEEEMGNTLCATLAALKNDRLMDRRDYAGSLDLVNSLLDGDNALMLLHRNMLECDRITASLLLGNNSYASKMTDPDFSRFLISMKNYPSVLRTQYVYELLYTRNRAKAEEIRNQFGKVALSHPYECEITAEREKMADADKLCAAQNA